MSFIERVRQLDAEQKKQPERDPFDSARVSSGSGKGYAEAALDGELEILERTPQGQRNNQLNKSAYNLGQLVAGGALDEDTVTAELGRVGRQIGLEDREIRAAIKSGLTAGMKEPRTAPEPEPRSALTLTTAVVPAGGELFDARDELRTIREFARSRRASPLAVLGAVLVRVVVATPKWVVLPPLVGGHASLNLYAGLVGASGTGKGAAESVAAEVVDVGHIEIAHVGSGEGIAHLFVRRTKDGIEQHTHAVLFSVAEIDTLTALTERRGATLWPELRKAWTGEQLGFAYADPAKRLPLGRHTYRLGMVAGIQPLRAGPVLDDRDAGTPQRLIWMPAVDPDAPSMPEPTPEPVKWKLPAPLHADDLSGRVVLPVCRAATDLIDGARLARLRGQADALDGHALLCRLKVAAALGLLNGHAEVTETDWDLAGIVMDVSDRTRASVIEELRRAKSEQNRARGEAEADRAIITEDRTLDAAIQRVCRTVMRKLNREQDWTASTDLQRTVPGRDRAHFGAAVERLTEAGQIESRQTEGQGRPKIEYRAKTR